MSILPSALYNPKPVGPRIADIITIAKPAPPINCIILLHTRNTFGISLTLTRVKPVVVHPLVDSKIACEKGKMPSKIKGKEENIIPKIQTNKTINEPSCIVTGVPGFSFVHKLRNKPNPNDNIAVYKKLRELLNSPGYKKQKIHGIIITTEKNINSVPI